MTNDSISIPSPASQPAPADLARAVADAVSHVEGVHALGTLVERASDSVRQRVGLAGGVAGVTVDRGRDGRVSSAVSIIVDYPHKLHEVTDAVRAAARHTLDSLGSDRIDVDVTVTGVWGPFDTDPVDDLDETLGEIADSTGDTPAPASGGEDQGDTDDGGVPADGRRARRAPAAGTAAAPEREDTQEAVADALADVADTVAHAADDLRTHRDTSRP